jgi:hypothetical protein
VDEIVHGIFNGWFCGANIGHQILSFILIGLAALVIAASILQKNTQTRVAKGLASLSFLVFLPYFVARINVLSGPLCIAMAVILARVIYDAIYSRYASYFSLLTWYGVERGYIVRSTRRPNNISTSFSPVSVDLQILELMQPCS